MNKVKRLTSVSVVVLLFVFVCYQSSKYRTLFRKHLEVNEKLQAALAASVKETNALKKELEGRKTVVPKADAQADEDLAGDLKAYRKLILEKERKLAELNNQLAGLQTNLEKVTREREERRSRRRNPRRNLEELKKTDPERYEQIRKRLADMNSRMQEGVWEKEIFLKELDMSKMTDEQKLVHEQVLEKLAKIQDLSDLLEGSDEAFGDMRREMFTEMRDLNGMLEKEREVIFHEMAMNLGYSQEEAADVVEYIDQVVKMTDARSMFRRGGRGGSRGSRD